MLRNSRLFDFFCSYLISFEFVLLLLGLKRNWKQCSLLIDYLSCFSLFFSSLVIAFYFYRRSFAFKLKRLTTTRSKVQLDFVFRTFQLLTAGAYFFLLVKSNNRQT